MCNASIVMTFDSESAWKWQFGIKLLANTFYIFNRLLFQPYSTYIVDAVMTFSYAVGSLYRKSNNSVVHAERLSCEADGEPWKYGDLMLHYLKNVL